MGRGPCRRRVRTSSGPRSGSIMLGRCSAGLWLCSFFFFQAEDGIRDWSVTGVQTCALPISTTGQPDPLEVTEDHPVLGVIRPPIKGGKRLLKDFGVLRWVLPSTLKVGDYLVKPRIVAPETESVWEVPIPVSYRGKHRQSIWSEQLVQVPLTPEIGRLVGYYLAEGSADDRRLVFSFHVREQAYRDDIRAIADKYFGVRGKEEQNTGKGRNARFDSYLLARVFGSLGP